MPAAALQGETAAQAYERLLVPALFAPTAALAVRLAAVTAGERVLDVACGTGIGLRAAAAHAGRLGTSVGVDGDPAMVAAARETLLTGEDSVNVLVASASRLPLRSAAFDVCLCLQGLQFFDDRLAALRDMRRVLTPGGRLVVSAWASLEHVPGHLAVYTALDAQGIDTTSPRRGFALPDPGTLRALAVQAGLSVVTIEVEEREARFASPASFVEGVFRGAPYTRRVTAALGESQRRRCVEEACRRLRAFESNGGLTLPLRSHVLVASP